MYSKYVGLVRQSTHMHAQLLSNRFSVKCSLRQMYSSHCFFVAPNTASADWIRYMTHWLVCMAFPEWELRYFTQLFLVTIMYMCVCISSHFIEIDLCSSSDPWNYWRGFKIYNSWQDMPFNAISHPSKDWIRLCWSIWKICLKSIIVYVFRRMKTNIFLIHHWHLN